MGRRRIRRCWAPSTWKAGRRRRTDPSAERLRRVSPHFERGRFRPLPLAQTFDLDHGPDAYRAVAEKKVRGRVVIQP
ncbi:zinc-binding dehydrogenase [Streptomyces sp. SF28]|nr:zinc-binding dehydrogenase [Streptomyces pinistramenti]